MGTRDFHCSITANIPLKEAFESIRNRVPEWWTKNFEGSSKNIGDVFTTRFGETFGTFKIIEMVANKKIVWLTTDCNLHFLQNKKEWKGTKMLWEFSANGNTTQIHFTHIGLVPEIECFTDCCGGWTHYVTGSLLKLLTEQKGEPDHENYSAKYKQ
jgi:hypothetical protein